MPVVVSCSCGKQLRVPDEMAGRRIKCPACGAIQAVPAAQATQTAPPARNATAASPAPAASEGTIRFACDCGKQMQARAEYAGKATRCPACKATVQIPGSPADPDEDDDREVRVRADRPAPKKAARARDDEDEDFDERDEDDEGSGVRRRRKGRGQRRVWPWVAAVAGLLLLIGGGLTAWLLLRGGKMTPDLALVPGNAQAFITIRLADVWNSDYTKQALAEAKKQNPNLPDIAVLAEQELGLSPADVERLTIVAADLQQGVAWGIVYTNKPYDRGKLLGKLTSAQERKQGGKAYQVGTKDGKPLALYFHDDRTFLVGQENGIQQALTSMAGKRASGPLDDILKKASGKHHLVAGIIPPQAEMAKAKQSIPPAMKAYESLLDLQSASLVLDLGKPGGTMDLEVGLNFPDKGKAEAAKKAIDSTLVLAKGFLPGLQGQLINGLPPDQANKLGQDINKAVDSLKVNQSGAAVVLTAQAPMGDPAQGVAALLGAVGKVRNAAGNAAGSNNLKQLALALMNYADSHQGQLPQAVYYSPQGKPLYSWRVEILPYIDEGALYNQFKKDEAWDSPHNKALLARMPKCFALPEESRPGLTTTHYQLITGPGLVFDKSQRSRFPASFQDGTSNTILVAEAAVGVPWTKPDDIPYTSVAQVRNKLRVTANGKYHFAMADGRIVQVSRTVTDQTLDWAIKPADGMPLGPDWDR